MKKLFTLLILLGGVLLAQAQQVYVGGILVSAGESASQVKSGTAKLSSDGKTLVLTDAVIESTKSGNSGIKNDGVDGLKIIVNGTCSITNSSNGGHGLYCTANTTLSTNTGGSLTINTKEVGSSYYGINVTGSSTLLVEWINLKVNGNYYSIYGSNSATLKLQCTEAYLSNTNGSNSCINGFSSLTTNANYWSSNNVFKDNKLYLSNGTTLAKSASLEACLKVGTAIVNINNSWAYPYSSTGGLSAGSISYDQSTKTLTFNNATFKSPGNTTGVENKRVEGLTVKLQGKNNISLTSTSSGAVFSSYQDLNIVGDGTSSTCQNTIKAYLPMYIRQNKKLSISTAYLVLQGSNYAIAGDADNANSLEITNSYIQAESFNSGGSFIKATIGNISSCKLSGCDVDVSKSSVCYQSSLKGFGTATELTKKAVYIAIPTTKYDIDICGIQVTNLNASNFLTDGLTSGKISWDNGTKTLTLDGVTLASKNPNQAVVRPQVAATIKVKGDNKLSGGHSIFYPNRDLTIEGSGKLRCSSAGANFGGVLMGGSYTLTLNVDGTVEFADGPRGFSSNSVSNCKVVLKKAGSQSDYYFKETDCAMRDIKGGLTLTNMDFYSGSSGYPGCYYDDADGRIEVNGGAVATGVDFYRLNDDDKYNLWVGGVQVTANNRYGIGSKHITEGGGYAVKYNGSSTLTLSGAKIEATSDTYGNCIRVANAYNGYFTLNVASNSTLISDVSGKSCFFIESPHAPTTIQGSGELKIGGSTTNGIVSWSDLTIDNVSMNMSNVLSGSSVYPTLTVKLTTPGKVIRVNGNVKDWGSLILDEGTKIVDPDGGYFSSSKYGVVKSDGSTLASPVVFADKTSTAIDGITTDADAEVIGIYDAQGRKLEEMQQGVNIIRMSDGTTKKIIKK